MDTEIEQLRRENQQLRWELEVERGQRTAVPTWAQYRAAQLATSPEPRPKPHVSLEEARAMAARAAAMRRAADRAEDPDA